MIGKVLGTLELKRSSELCGEYRWLQVRVDGCVREAVDLTGAGAGEQVLLLAGEDVRRICMGCPGNLAAVAVLAGTGNNG